MCIFLCGPQGPYVCIHALMLWIDNVWYNYMAWIVCYLCFWDWCVSIFDMIWMMFREVWSYPVFVVLYTCRALGLTLKNGFWWNVMNYNFLGDDVVKRRRHGFKWGLLVGIVIFLGSEWFMPLYIILLMSPLCYMLAEPCGSPLLLLSFQESRRYFGARSE